MNRMRLTTILALVTIVLACGATALAKVDATSVTERLNMHNSVIGPASSKGWRVLFDAYLNMSAPPMKVGDGFNANTIWPGMDDWSSVSDWAKANASLAVAMKEASGRVIIGLPYGADNVPATYRSKGVMVEIWTDGNLRNNNFAYLDALSEILAFSTAETYRLFEAGEIDSALELAMVQLRLLRKFCDRDFLVEKSTCMQHLIDSLQNMRDYFYMYGSKMSAEQLRNLSLKEIPYLRPDRNRLFIPEADRIVAEEILNSVFDKSTGNAQGHKFREVFTEIQADVSPLGRFGAARRWEEIAAWHGGLPATQERLKNIFDDWWRRWRIRSYSSMLGVETEYDKTNPTRYAAVIFIVNDIMDVFNLRELLVIESRGTTAAAALCSYRNALGRFPSKLVALYPDPLSRQHAEDIFDEELNPLQYRAVESRTAIDINAERRWVESGACLLYSVGSNAINDSKLEGHPVHGGDMDLLLWPPVNSLLRNVTPSP
jgi:hypothetical protein